MNIYFTYHNSKAPSQFLHIGETTKILHLMRCFLWSNMSRRVWTHTQSSCKTASLRGRCCKGALGDFSSGESKITHHSLHLMVMCDRDSVTRSQLWHKKQNTNLNSDYFWHLLLSRACTAKKRKEKKRKEKFMSPTESDLDCRPSLLVGYLCKFCHWRIRCQCSSLKSEIQT